MMNSSGYPYTRCLEPKQIVNPYTHEKMIVPCGHCVACSLSKSTRSSLKCRLESMSHKYTYFVTLTFASEYLPLADIYRDEFGNCTLYDIDTGDILYDGFQMSELDIAILKKKANCGGYIPYLRKRDVQLFLKRLRKLIPHEKIRYYAVGEYGPVHFRPHYHLLLWFDEPYTASIIQFLIRQSWPFGRVDCQKSKGAASSYTAGYLNCACNLPRIFKVSKSKCKTFALHSFFLGETVLAAEREKVYEMPVKDFVQRSFFIDGTYTEFTLWRSLKSFFYPKCIAYSVLSPDERYKSYRIYIAARRIFGAYSCIYQAKEIIDILSFDSGVIDLYHHDAVVNDFIKFIVHVCRVDCSRLNDPEYAITVQRSVYMLLRTSRHFLKFVCNGDECEKVSKFYVKKIEDFYKDYDLLMLNEQYKTLENLDYFDDDDMIFVYNNVPFKLDQLRSSRFFRSFASETQDKYNDRVKHKILNDRNKIFNNI